VAGRNEYPAKAGRVNRHIGWYTSPYPWSYSVVLLLGYRLLASRDQRRLTGSSSASEACSRQWAIQIPRNSHNIPPTSEISSFSFNLCHYSATHL